MFLNSYQQFEDNQRNLLAIQQQQQILAMQQGFYQAQVQQPTAIYRQPGYPIYQTNIQLQTQPQNQSHQGHSKQPQ